MTDLTFNFFQHWYPISPTDTDDAAGDEDRGVEATLL
jgi:hypothetical protein